MNESIESQYQRLHDAETKNLFDLKLQLGIVKKDKPKNVFAPFTRLKRKPEIYKTSKCSFNSETIEAYSYGWWQFVEKVGSKVVFNNYNYSHTTNKHQYETLYLMKKLGVKIDFEFKARLGLQNGLAYQTAIEDYNFAINTLNKQIAKPRSHKTKNKDRLQEIKEIKDTIKMIKKLQKVKK